MNNSVVHRVEVRADSPYEVVIGRGVSEQVTQLIGPASQRVAVLHAPSVRGYAERVGELLQNSHTVHLHALADAEAAKTVESLASCWDFLGDAGFTRSDAVVAVGGGATTDLAGFVAASWLRGIDVVHIPTTTLAMVDAAVGGKTGINTSAGKNLVGAFHEPRGVLVDLEVLDSLPRDEHQAGLAEVIKAGFIRDTAIVDLVESRADEILDSTSSSCAEVIVRSIAVKAEVVSADLRERAGGSLSREILNYGHTLGHAIERAEGYKWRHGHAISVGMVFAAEVAQRLAMIDTELVAQHRRLLTTVGLPTNYGGNAGFDQILEVMRIDKKSRGSTLRMVLLNALGSAKLVADPPTEVLESAFAAITAPQ